MAKLTSDDRAKIIEMYESGMTARSIAKIFDCSEPTIMYHVHMKGGVSKGKGGTVSRTIDIPPKKEEVVQEEQSLLVIGNAKILGSLHIGNMMYKLDSINQTLTIAKNGGEIAITFDEIQCLLKDLTVISEHTTDLERKVQLEAW